MAVNNVNAAPKGALQNAFSKGLDYGTEDTIAGDKGMQEGEAGEQITINRTPSLICSNSQLMHDRTVDLEAPELKMSAAEKSDLLEAERRRIASICDMPETTGSTVIDDDIDVTLATVYITDKEARQAKRDKLNEEIGTILDILLSLIRLTRRWFWDLVAFIFHCF